MRLLVITGDEQRHRFFAESLHQVLGLVGVVFEKKANKHKTFDYSEKDREVVEQHFAARDESELKYFGNTELTIPAENIRSVETGATNDAATFDWICDKAPDIIQLFGSSLIGDHILEHFKGRVVNLHLGLSPYYRGSGTNFWAMVDGELACVGATIHLATNKVDAGEILFQIRPELATSDTPHDIGNKTILAALEVLPDVLQRFAAGELAPIPQDLSKGKVFLRKNLTAEAILKHYEHFKNGAVQQYLDSLAQMHEQYPIISQ